MVRNIVGNIPEPDELYGRDEFIANLWRQLEGNNILLLAPRRFGKSGVMRHVLLRPKANYIPIYFELEDVATPEEFVWRMSRELLSRDTLRSILQKASRMPRVISGWIKDTFDEVGFEGAKVKFKASIKEDWREASRRMLLELEKADERIILIFDEFPSMLDKIIEKSGEEVARQFMAWFRAVRLEQKDVLRRHRFIVGGSIGIDIILRRIDASDKLVDFQRLYVEPVDRESADQLACDLAESFNVRWSPEMTDHILELVGPPVPYFIHLFFSQIAVLPSDARHSLSKETLDSVFRNRVLGPTCKNYFEHYRTRLRKRYGASGEKAAYAVLGAVAGSPRGLVSRSALYDVYRRARGKYESDIDFDALLGDLESDWYLVLDTNTNEYHFMLNVMRDWWRRWFPPAATRKKSKGAGRS